MAYKEKVEIFPKDPTKTYGLMELAKGRGPLIDKEPEDTVFTWPNLVYIELLMALAIIVVLFTLAIFFDAPLEELASYGTTPNPMKAPWYFLGLQESLVYFDPWIAGVALPVTILTGLMLIPYLDVNPKGIGEYNFRDRKFAITIFISGLILWYILIIIGMWFRGLDWNFYWPWDNWTQHKPLAGGLVDMPFLFTQKFGISSIFANIICYMIVLGYFFAGLTIPLLLFRRFYKDLGCVRYGIVMTLFLLMLGVPMKIFLRLLFSIKYVVVTPWFKI
ncbi:MAG: cytochrome B6 [Thermodesulfobacteriota bacterium]